MENTDLGLFIGRFHPLIVHLPVGFIILAFLLDIASRFNLLGMSKASPFINIIWLLSALASLAAVGCGWLLAENGGYGGDTLFWHKWLGIALTGLTLGYWLVRQFNISSASQLTMVVPFLLVGLISATGHLGGNLTHGANYLFEYAPPLVKDLLGPSTQNSNVLDLPPPDSVVLFTDVIHPIIEEKCIHCHNDENTSGGLNLSTAEGYKNGGDGGKIIAAGSALNSEIFKRVTLLPSSRKFMPPSGEQLSFSQIKLLSHWLDNGASFDQKLSETNVSEDLQALLIRDYQYDISPQPIYSRISIEPLSDQIRSNLIDAGFEVITLAKEKAWLQVKAKEGMVIDNSRIELLKKAAKQITWLDLSNVSLTDDHLQVINSFPHLTRLRIQQNDISDQGLAYLKDLKYLESINVLETNISREGLEKLSALTSLKRIYAWKTNITKEDKAALIDKYPELSIDIGFTNNI